MHERYEYTILVHVSGLRLQVSIPIYFKLIVTTVSINDESNEGVNGPLVCVDLGLGALGGQFGV